MVGVYGILHDASPTTAYAAQMAAHPCNKRYVMYVSLSKWTSYTTANQQEYGLLQSHFVWFHGSFYWTTWISLETVLYSQHFEITKSHIICQQLQSDVFSVSVQNIKFTLLVIQQAITNFHILFQ